MVGIIKKGLTCIAYYDTIADMEVTVEKEYTYKCSDCGKVDIIKLTWCSDVPEVWKCPHCKHGMMKRDLLVDLRSTTTHIGNNFRAVKKY